MALTAEARAKLAAQIAALKKRTPHEFSDLDYESNLRTIRALQRILDRDAAEARKKDDGMAAGLENNCPAFSP